MIHTDFNWFEMRVAGEMRRQLVPIRHVADELSNLGARPTDAHLSIFRYSNDIREYRNENGGSVSGYNGPSYADYVPIDIDAPGFEDLDQAVETARTVIGDLQGWGLSYDDVVVYYSGRRGFHILIPTLHFGEFDPHPQFHDLLFEMVVELFHQGTLVKKVETSAPSPVIESDHIDFGPYSRLHMLRMPATIHEKTELWKIPVRERELMNGSAEEAANVIKKTAEERRPKYRPDPNPNEETIDLGDRVRGRINGGGLKYRRRSSAVNTMDINDYVTADTLRQKETPGFGRVAMNAQKTMKILSGDISEGESIEDMGGRHDMLCHLVGVMKNQWDLPKDWTSRLMYHWNQSNDPPLPDQEFKQIINDLYGR